MILSYSLFAPKQNHSHIRTWDKFYSNDRYWVNIPAILIIYKNIFPDIKIKFYISPNITQHPLFDMLNDFSKEGLCEIIIINREYHNTEPAFWRYIPVFEKQDDIILCRDIDSIPSITEFRALDIFIESQFGVSTIRSHTQHCSSATILLAGLSTFKPKILPQLIDQSFDIFYDNHISKFWGSDQENLIRLMMNDKEWVKNNFLDFKSPSPTHPKISEPILNCSSQILPYVPTYYSEITEWSGQPVDCRSKNLIHVQKTFEPHDPQLSSLIETIINRYPYAQRFYLH